MKTTDHRKDYQLWQWAFTFIIHQTFALQEHCCLQAQHFISASIGVSIFLGCDSLLTIVLEMISWFGCCNEVGKSFLGTWASLLTILENVDNVISTGTSHWGTECGIQLMLFAWRNFSVESRKKTNLKQNSYTLHSSLYCPSPSTYVSYIYSYIVNILHYI